MMMKTDLLRSSSGRALNVRTIQAGTNPTEQQPLGTGKPASAETLVAATVTLERLGNDDAGWSEERTFEPEPLAWHSSSNNLDGRLELGLCSSFPCRSASTEQVHLKLMRHDVVASSP